MSNARAAAASLQPSKCRKRSRGLAPARSRWVIPRASRVPAWAFGECRCTIPTCRIVLFFACSWNTPCSASSKRGAVTGIHKNTIDFYFCMITLESTAKGIQSERELRSSTRFDLGRHGYTAVVSSERGLGTLARKHLVLRFCLPITVPLGPCRPVRASPDRRTRGHNVGLAEMLDRMCGGNNSTRTMPCTRCLTASLALC